jgi:hypothetical protein
VYGHRRKSVPRGSVSRILSYPLRDEVIIHLGRPSPAVSSGLPAPCPTSSRRGTARTADGTDIHDLAPGGVYPATAVTVKYKIIFKIKIKF